MLGVHITGRQGLVWAVRDTCPEEMPSAVRSIQTTPGPNLCMVPSANPLSAARPLSVPNPADLPAVLPVPHERHLPVVAPAHDTQVTVGRQGHVPCAGPQSREDSGGGGGRHGSRPQRAAPLMPERLCCPPLRNQPGPGANAMAQPTATPLP